MKNIKAVILAGGRGTRMKATVPKVLYPICGRPMIKYIIEALRSVKIKEIMVVVGYKSELLKGALKNMRDVNTVKQKKLLGSADALNQARPFLRKYSGDIFVLYGDTPLIKKETLQKLIETHKTSNASLTLLGCIFSDPTGYGRIVRNDSNEIVKIAEETDCSVFEKAIEEINVGVYCFKTKELFKFLSEIKPDNEKKEYFLTDIVSLMHRWGCKISSVITNDAEESLGVNSRVELARVEKIMARRTCFRFMQEGVTILDPDSTFINGEAEIGNETVIHPHTVIEGDVIIGRNCSIGPFARIRSGSRIDNNVEIGNFAEIVRTKVAKNAKIKHFSYIGDAVIGEGVNIGAGTVTANYDGKKKSLTEIKNGAFIGSGTILVAPVKIGANAVTGAGAVVTKNHDVPAGGIVVGVPAHTLKERGKK